MPLTETIIENAKPKEKDPERRAGGAGRGILRCPMSC